MLTFISIVVLLLMEVLLYFYLIHRKDENKTIKQFFAFSKERRYLILTACSWVAAIGLYCYKYYFCDSSFLRAFLDASTLIWILAIGYIDLKEKIIPNAMILSGIVFWVVLSVIEIFWAHTAWQQILYFSLAGAGVCGGMFILIALVVKNALGMGDAKMVVVLGLLYGLTNTYSIILFSVFIMAVVSIVLLIAKKVTKKTTVPMAPFFVIGFLIHTLIGM